MEKSLGINIFTGVMGTISAFLILTVFMSLIHGYTYKYEIPNDNNHGHET